MEISNLFGLDQLTDWKFEEFVKLSRFYACSPVGLMMRTLKESESFLAQPLPFTLLPAPFPKHLFQEALQLQIHFNTLIEECTKDHEFLVSALKEPAQSDSFIAKLLEILKENSSPKRITLNMIRSDYMLHPIQSSEVHSQQKYQLKQVEINTIAAGFLNVGPRVADLHKFTLSYHQELMKSSSQMKQASNTVHYDTLNYTIPENKASEMSALALATAYNKYCEVFKSAKPNTIILFVVVADENEYNVFDQRPIEIRLFKEYGIMVRRMTIKALADKASLGSNKELMVDGQEIAVSYFRTGYNEKFYPTESEWELRIRIEQSRTVSVPSVAVHLATFKSIQQKLYEPGVVEKYIKSASIARKIRDTFAEQIALDDSNKAKEALALVRQDPKLYVLKPNKEGGGNNVFDDEIPPMLKKLENTCEMKNYILMERLNPPELPLCLVHPTREAKLTSGNSELGVFGYFVSVDGEVEMNVEGGHVLRSKDKNDNECGVSSGIGYVDSPLLY